MEHDPAMMTPGDRIRLFRRRAGLTQEQAAGLKGCTVSAWRKWESGERQVTSLTHWVEIARVLRVRDLYQLTGLPVGQLPDEPGEYDAVPAIRSALYAYGSRTGPPVEPASLAAAVDFAWDTWFSSPNRFSRTGAMLPDLIRQARAATLASSGRQRREVHRVAASLYLLVRSYTKRVGARELSVLAAAAAVNAADIADDPCTRGAAAWTSAMVLSTAGHTEESAALIRDALAELDDVDGDDARRLSVLGGLHLLLSVQLARLRDERGAVQALDTAGRVAAVTGETDYHRLVFGPTNVAIHRSAVVLELSRPGEALRLAEKVDVSTSPSLERRHSHYLTLARGYAIRRDDVGALHMLLRAERESTEDTRLNVIVRATVRELMGRETAATRQELRGLAGRIGVI